VRSVSGQQLARALEHHGWTLLRVQGSHRIYGRPGVAVRLSVPCHAGKNLKSGLLHHLLRLAGLEQADLD
jgi:predicted RNA binding protein YcfA (HicA-like mRNA interferase family)